jgi:hypothetical protein
VFVCLRSCDVGWTNGDCVLALNAFPHEIDVLEHRYYRSEGGVFTGECGMLFNHVSFLLIDTAV